MIPDLLQKNLRLVFCGSALSSVSHQKQAYYAGPQNRFWKNLFEIGLTQETFLPQDYKKLLDLGVGLMDVVKDQKGMDREINFEERHQKSVLERIEKFRPKVLAFTSKAAFQSGTGKKKAEYGKQDFQIGETEVWVLTSPSAAARRYWNLQPWIDLARRVS